MNTTEQASTGWWVELAGWYGMTAVLGAYALVSLEFLDNTSWLFQLLNLTGALGLLATAWSKRATQVVLLNVAWAAIAMVALVRLSF